MTTASVGASSDLREWGSPAAPRLSPLEWLWLAFVVGVPGAIVVLSGALLAGARAALVAGLTYAGLVAWWLSRQSRAALSAIGGAEIVVPADAPRFANLAAAIARELSLASPRLMVAEGGPVNAFACWAGGPVIATSRALLDAYTRTELEAVVAHSLIRLSGPDRRRAALGAALGRAAGPLGVLRHPDDDLRTAAFTRYPVALASAIAKASPVGGRRASFWFVPQALGSASQTERTAGLRDL